MVLIPILMMFIIPLIINEMMAVQGKLTAQIHDAFRHASPPVEVKTQGFVLGNDVPEKITIPCTRGNQKLIGVCLDALLPVEGSPSKVAGKTATDLFKRIDAKGDGVELIESSSSKALREHIRIFWDSPISDALPESPGNAQSRIIVPVSGRGFKNMKVNIKFPEFSELYSAGTEGAGKVLCVSAIYGPVDLPRFIHFSNTQNLSSTGRRNVDQTGPMEEKAFPCHLMVIGDGTIVVDDCMYKDAGGNEKFDDKQDRIKAYYQLKKRETLDTNGLVYVDIETDKVASDRDRFILDVTTPGSIDFLGLYSMDSLAVVPESVEGSHPSPNQNVPEEVTGQGGYVHPTPPGSGTMGPAGTPKPTGGGGNAVIDLNAIRERFRLKR